MSTMHGARREIQRLRDKLRAEDQDFRAGAPIVDEDGLPNWDGCEPLTIEEFMKAMGVSPDAELSVAELEARRRLAPYAEVFRRLEETEKAEKAEAGP